MRLLTVNRRIRRWMGWLALILVASLLVILWQRFTTLQPVVTTPAQVEITKTDEPIQPIPLEIATDKPKVALGEQLFQDVRLSKNSQKSCLSCHSFSLGGADRIAHSIGIDGANTKVNTPTVFNVRFNFRFNWDGEFTNLADHLDALMSNPRTMGTQWPTAIRSLQQVPAYVRAFSQIYPDGVTATNIKDAIVAYELSLNTPNARFDRFLLGDKTALTSTEKEGYRLFKNYGCVSCHQGVNIGGNMFQPFGVIGNYLIDRGQIKPADLGHFNVSENEADRYVFRVPSLRNVAVTAPYFHDGSAQTLTKAIEQMTKYQLGRSLAKKQIEQIAEFLGTLTGEYRGKPL
ncbi:cytochrome-c peroxidase [Chamaesiphon sp.]|uniref:cytochrome-c peroxidase n=1 Tax=Chamaesiphon sp. TaxID=2814140 RepID=UPI003593A9A5